MVGTPKPGKQLTTLVQVHESRLIVLKGVRTSRLRLNGQYGIAGDSVFTRVNRVLRDFNVSWGAAGILVNDFAQPVFKMEGLAKMMEKDNKELFQARMLAVALSMSTARAVLIDSNEEYKREQTPVTGLPELLELFCKRLARRSIRRPTRSRPRPRRRRPRPHRSIGAWARYHLIRSSARPASQSGGASRSLTRTRRTSQRCISSLSPLWKDQISPSRRRVSLRVAATYPSGRLASERIGCDKTCGNNEAIGVGTKRVTGSERKYAS